MLNYQNADVNPEVYLESYTHAFEMREKKVRNVDFGNTRLITVSSRSAAVMYWETGTETTEEIYNETGQIW